MALKLKFTVMVCIPSMQNFMLLSLNEQLFYQSAKLLVYEGYKLHDIL